jgi:hypothetical protein
MAASELAGIKMSLIVARSSSLSSFTSYLSWKAFLLLATKGSCAVYVLR